LASPREVRDPGTHERSLATAALAAHDGDTAERDRALIAIEPPHHRGITAMSAGRDRVLAVGWRWRWRREIGYERPVRWDRLQRVGEGPWCLPRGRLGGCPACLVEGLQRLLCGLPPAGVFHQARQLDLSIQRLPLARSLASLLVCGS